MKLPVSVVISAYNEEKKIADCLSSVQWADEVIVVNNSSTDDTEKIAKKHGAKIFVRENNLMLNVNKNYGFEQAKHEWILSLDADERVTEELRMEIESVLEQRRGSIEVAGFWIPRRNIIFSKWIEHTGWYPDKQLRLFKKSNGKFAAKHVHEMIELKGEAGDLTSPMMHLAYESVAQFLQKTMVIYAPNEAAELLRNGYVFHVADVIRFPLNEFLSRFFLRQGYKDGLHGLVLSCLMAFYHLVVFCYIWEKRGFEEKNNIHGLLEEEMRSSAKEIRYWMNTIRVDHASGLTKVFLKVKRRLG